MFKEILQSRWFTAAAVVLIGFLAISFVKIEPALITTRKELNNLDRKIAEVKKSAFDIERLGDYIKSDVYLERQARLKLNYKKPDERVVYVYTTEAQKGQEDRNLDQGIIFKMTTEARNEKEAQKNLEKSKIFENKLITNLKSWWGYLVGK